VRSSFIDNYMYKMVYFLLQCQTDVAPLMCLYLYRYEYDLMFNVDQIYALLYKH